MVFVVLVKVSVEVRKSMARALSGCRVASPSASSQGSSGLLDVNDSALDEGLELLGLPMLSMIGVG